MPCCSLVPVCYFAFSNTSTKEEESFTFQNRMFWPLGINTQSYVGKEKCCLASAATALSRSRDFPGFWNGVDWRLLVRDLSSSLNNKTKRKCFSFFKTFFFFLKTFLISYFGFRKILCIYIYIKCIFFLF